jgi:hypothetical protein
MVASKVQSLLVRQLGHTQGASRRSGRTWNALDSLSVSCNRICNRLRVSLPDVDKQVLDVVTQLVVASVICHASLAAPPTGVKLVSDEKSKAKKY